jgi:membrane associated rhomboid family serine protease
MFPIRDDQPRFSTPYLTYFLIALNLVIYFFEWSMGPRNEQALAFQLGMIPARITGYLGGMHHVQPADAFLPILTSMFLHASWPHVILNMWFLWIFGDNIEDYLGHFQYLVFYLLSGFGAAVAHILLNPISRVPTVGASGAIAGVLGAYFLLYPRARVLTWFFSIFIFYLPAWVVLGSWFVLQFFAGAASTIEVSSRTSGGVAFWAHVGGFITGIVLIKLFPERRGRQRYGTW